MDIRPALDAPIGAFGLSVTVTPPYEATVQTYGIWHGSLFEDAPVGQELTRRDPRRVMSLPRADIADVPRGSLVVAPEMEGEASKNWRVDGIEKTESDHVRVILIPEAA